MTEASTPGTTPATNRITTSRGYDLIADSDVPLHFWLSSGDSQEIATCLEALADSMEVYGFCWLVWNPDNQALYEQRDLYECSVTRVVEHDSILRGKNTPCGDLRRRASLPIFLSVQQFWQILASVPLADQSIYTRGQALLSTSSRGEQLALQPAAVV
jgi:hypothetical protein